MKPKIYEQFVESYVILDCAIAGREQMAFILKEEPEDEFDERRPEELPTRILSYAHDMIDHNEGFALAAKWEEGFSKIYLAFNQHENQFIAIDDDFCSLESKTAFEFHENEGRFLSDDRRLWVLDGEVPKPYDFPKDGPIQYSARGVKSAPDVLVAYGLYQALAFDSQSWTEIIANPLIWQNKN